MCPIKILDQDCYISFARSGGKGGQNVNKIESKVTLRWNPILSALLSDSELRTLMQNKQVLAHLNKQQEIVVTCQTYRTQAQNRSAALERLNQLVNRGLIIKRKRIKTKVPAGVRERRLQNKKRLSLKKKTRGQLLD